MSEMPNVGIGAGGHIGIALEAAPGTYVEPEKFFPIRSEGLSWTQNTMWRRVIRGTADVIGAVPGNGNVEGDVEAELLDDVLPYFLQCARGDLVQTAGTEPNTHEYEFIPNHKATPNNTMSITVVRNDVVFAYVGCVVSSMSFGTDDAMGTMTFSLLGMREEKDKPLPTPVYNDDDQPFGAGTWRIDVPVGTQIFDADNFSFEVDDSGEVQFRLKDELGAQFVAYGERNVSLSLDRDFENRDEYEAFKELTSKQIHTKLQQGDTRIVEFDTPAAIIDSYDLGLSGVGDLIRASISYNGVHDADTGGGYSIRVVTTEDLGLAA